MISSNEIRVETDGEALRDAGIVLASNGNRDRINRLELRFLDALSKAGSGTLDLAEDNLRKKYADGGKWRGGILMRLARGGLIISIGAQKSKRRARHAGLLNTWSIRDAAAVNARRQVLRSLLVRKDDSLFKYL